MTIYIDELFIINITIDYFLLLGTAKICGVYTKRRRLITGAAAGAVYACLGVLPGLEFLEHPAFWLPSAVLMVFCAFGKGKRIIKVTAVFLALSAAAAGVLTAVSSIGGNALGRINLRVLCLAFAGSYILLSLIFKRAARGGVRYVTLYIKYGERELSLRALCDTGNTLRDPLTGCGCAVIPRGLVSAPASVVWHEVICATVGGETILQAFIPDKCTIDGKAAELSVCVSETAIADNALYEAIVPEKIQ